MLAPITYVFLIIFINTVVYSTTCPDYIDHRCTCDTHMYNCAGRGLTDMVKKTDDSVRSLDLSQNEIAETVVLDAPSLTYLSLANNRLKKLQYDTFDNLDELKTLILSHNRFSRITDDIFEWNPLKLEVLKLDSNEIEFIQHFLFYDLEQLTELDMSNNNITFIHPHAFAQLKKLTILKLNGNHLHTFDSKWIKGLRANMFSEINLSDNPWACDCTMKQQAKWLESKKAKWFNDALLEDLVCQNPYSFKGKKVKSITGKQIGKLECSDPKIVGISETTHLFVNQSIELDCVVKSDSFPVPSIMWIAPNKDHYNLQTADRFKGIEVFQNGTMIIHQVELDDDGEYKCVASNNKSSVEASTTLHISLRSENPSDHENSNPAETTTEKPLTFTPKNKPIHVDNACPQKCKCLSQHVDCSSDTLSDKLTDINYDTLPNNTASASFVSNSITSVPPAPANTFIHLTELRLDNNRISDIAAHAFDNLEQLQTLTLRDNKLTAFHGKPFRRLKKLKILVLDNNELTVIDDNMFYGLSSVQWIYMRHNLIKSISTAAFAHVPKVKFIHLEANNIGYILPDTITALTVPKDNGEINIKKIFVNQNFFICDCNMNGLKSYLTQNEQWNNLFNDGISCGYPPALYQRHLRDIEEPLVCNGTKPLVSETTITDSGAMSGLWFAGLLVGLALCALLFVLRRKYGRKIGWKSVRYSNLPRDDLDEYQSLTSGNAGSEAFV